MIIENHVWKVWKTPWRFINSSISQENLFEEPKQEKSLTTHTHTHTICGKNIFDNLKNNISIIVFILKTINLSWLNGLPLTQNKNKA